ncbi:MAG: TRAP transporter large permease subunit [Firmicutes bacterium]|nr:TRAP transporter large permease subunit [Bacillota bacterium]
MQTSPAIIATTIFLITYFFLITRLARPVFATSAAAIVLLLTGTLTIQEALAAINFNVLGIVGGMMILAELFIASRAPEYFASLLVGRVRTAGVALVVVSAFAGVISAFVDNVATVLIVAPIAFDIAKRLHTSPAPFLIGIAISSNLQGTATLIGDATSVMLATAANLNFLDFFWLEGRPGIFFVVEIGAVAATLILWFMFRHLKQEINFEQTNRVLTWVPTALLGGVIATLALSSFIPNRPDNLLGLITIGFGLLGILWNTLWGHLDFSWQDLDWETLMFLTGVFILVGSLSATGVVSSIASWISQLTGGSILITFLVLVWMSVLVSAFVDNIPYTLAMLPVAQQVAASVGTSPYLLMFGLMIGTTLGGNITPIGASANVVAVGLLRKQGVDVSFGEFVRIGLPFTLTAVLTASILLWLFWA